MVGDQDAPEGRRPLLLILPAARGSCHKPGALSRVPCSLPRTVLQLDSVCFFHLILYQHRLFVRPGTSAAIATNSLLSYVYTACSRLMSSSSVALPVILFARSLATGNQGIAVPSVITLLFCSTWNQRGNCSPNFATVPLYCILQLAVFI